MSSTQPTKRPAGNPGLAPAGRPLVRVLNAALTAGCERGLDALAVTGHARSINITARTEADVIRWATALGSVKPVRRTPEPDLGIIVTAVDIEFDGYRINIQHVHRAPTIPGDQTE